MPQIYTDWLYLWWVGYANTPKMHGSLYIILKESLKYIPIVGPGMMFYGFIFMSRKMAVDQPRLAHRLGKLKTRHTAPDGKKYLDPMWLLLFPEGTNASQNGRNKSAKWAEKIGVKDPEHMLLPRSTGTYFCLNELKGTVDYVYDCTVAYEGVPYVVFSAEPRIQPLTNVAVVASSARESLRSPGPTSRGSRPSRSTSTGAASASTTSRSATRRSSTSGCVSGGTRRTLSWSNTSPPAASPPALPTPLPRARSLSSRPKCGPGILGSSFRSSVFSASSVCSSTLSSRHGTAFFRYFPELWRFWTRYPFSLLSQLTRLTHGPDARAVCIS